MRRRIAAALVVVAALAGACGRGADRPSTPAATITVVTATGGRSPAEADAAIALPIERAMTSVAGLAHISATSDAREVRVVGLLDAGADPYATSSRLREALQAIRDQLPADASSPSLIHRTRDRTPRVIVRDPQLPPDAVRTWTEWLLRPKVMQVEGIEDVEVCGGATARLDVVVDPERLAAFGIGVDQVVEAVAHDRADLPGATGARDDFVVRGGPASRGAVAAATIPARDGARIRVGDVAMLEERGEPDPCPAPAPADAVIADVHLRGDPDAARVLTAIRDAARDAPIGLTVQLVDAPIRYDVVLQSGLDPGLARDRAAAWRGALGGAPGVLAIEPMPPPAAIWRIDRAAADRAGVAMTSIAAALAVIHGGDEAATLIDGAIRRSIYVTLRAADTTDLGRVTVAGKGGPVALASLIARDVESGRIESFDLVPAVVLRVTIAAGDDADTIAAAAIARARAAAPLPAGVTALSWREP